MVAFCCRFAVTPHIMRRRHLESVSAALYGRCFASSVSSRSLAARGSWGTAPSVFWYGAPGGTQGPPGKGGAAERWRVAYPIGIATRHGAKPATTRAYKSRPPPGRHAHYAFTRGLTPWPAVPGPAAGTPGRRSCAPRRQPLPPDSWPPFGPPPSRSQYLPRFRRQ